MNKNVQVKKLVSLNPRRYKKVPLAFASFDYEVYLNSVAQLRVQQFFNWPDKIRSHSTIKTFIQWLETEV